eukprot:COSAG06_NODE_288_length_18224_cov_8.849948_3_plen_71_part_00
MQLFKHDLHRFPFKPLKKRLVSFRFPFRFVTFVCSNLDQRRPGFVRDGPVYRNLDSLNQPVPGVESQVPF